MAVEWDYVTEVESDSEPGTWHEIKRRRADGHLGCDCGRYRFAKKAAKTCHHIKAYEATQRGLATVSGVATPHRSQRANEFGVSYRIAVASENYTVGRRAITFGSIPAGGGR